MPALDVLTRLLRESPALSKEAVEQAISRVSRGESPYIVLTELMGLSTSPEARNLRRIQQKYPSTLAPEYHGTTEDFTGFDPNLEIFTAKSPSEAERYGHILLDIVPDRPPKIQTPTIQVYDRGTNFRSPRAQFNPHWKSLRDFLATTAPLSLLPPEE